MDEKINCIKCGTKVIKTCNNKKYCTKCKTTINYYSPKNRKKYRNKKAEKRYYEKNKELIKERSRKNQLKRRYSTTKGEIKKLLINQKYLCKICGNDIKNIKQCIDHDHSNGIIRGILCNNCNLGLGWFKDNITILENAIKYLKVIQ